MGIKTWLATATLWAVMAIPTHAEKVVERIHIPQGWTELSTPASNHMMRLHVGLQQQNLDTMIDELYAVSDPDSERYGNHYDREGVDKLVRPKDETNQKVIAWLRNAGIEQIHSDGHWVEFVTNVEMANKLLGTTFKFYENEDGLRKLRTTQYSVPDDLADDVDLITPTTYFSSLRPRLPSLKPSITTREDKASLSAPAASCSTSITPKCLKALYNLGHYVPKANSGSRIGFGSFLNQSAIYKDLYKYEKLFGIPKQGFKVELIHGGINNQSADLADVGEANLDVQNIIGLANPLPVTEFITGGLGPLIPNLDEPTAADDSNEPYLAYYKYLLSKKNAELPQVISNSYGDDEQTVPYKFAHRVCNMIAMMGMRGITIFESSGDTGVGAPCTSNDGKRTPEFTPQFPPSCPYLTAVGGTQAIVMDSPYEIAWLNGSGGFSNYFPRAKFQSEAVETYLTTQVKKSTLEYYKPFYNRHGRGFPDVSAHSLRPDYEVIYLGKKSPSGGTSAAAPVWGAIVGLLNDARLRAGKPALGYLNPFLYKRGYKALHDIKEGGSVGCTGVNAQTGVVLKGARKIKYASWNSTVGWDPVTGLGTPNFHKLKKMVLAM